MGGDRDARRRVIEDHLPLVRAVARRFVGRGETLEDLVQVGTIGLIKAVDRYDPTRDRALEALARPAIEGEIRHHLRDRVPDVRVPQGDREAVARVRAAARDLEQRERRHPATHEAAAAAGVDPARAARALAAAGATRAATLDAGSGAPAARDETEAAEARALLATGWERLDERERRLLELRYREDRSQSEIARELHLSQAHVSRLLRAALEHLRREVGEEPSDAPPHRPPAEPPPATPRSGRLLLRLPQSLHGEIARAAAREGVPVNTFIAGTLAGAVGWQDPDQTAAATTGHDASRPRPATLLIVNAVVVALAALGGLALLVAAWLG
jgi:RNA polymerase sigma-B factor